MPRPRKFRHISFQPHSLHFLPCEGSLGCGYHGGFSEVLEMEELEAIRLKDFERLEQTECAEKMQISRPTFQRILASARRKIADSLVNGKEIIINSDSNETETNNCGRQEHKNSRGFHGNRNR